jgi:hypothetical protein
MAFSGPWPAPLDDAEADERRQRLPVAAGAVDDEVDDELVLLIVVVVRRGRRRIGEAGRGSAVKTQEEN